MPTLIRDTLLRDPAKEGLVNNGQARITNEPDCSISPFKVESLSRIGRPVLEALKIASGAYVSQKCSHMVLQFQQAPTLAIRHTASSGVMTY